MKQSWMRAVMSELGKRGGPARAKALSAKRRREISQMGGKAKAKNLLDRQQRKS